MTTDPEKMRYILFGGSEIRGGAHDYIGGGCELDVLVAIAKHLVTSTRKRANKEFLVWWHIMDTEKGGEIVAGGLED